MKKIREEKLTGFPGASKDRLANASTPSMVEISPTSVRTSREVMELERSWESLAWIKGWVDMWTGILKLQNGSYSV